MYNYVGSVQIAIYRSCPNVCNITSLNEIPCKSEREITPRPAVVHHRTDPSTPALVSSSCDISLGRFAARSRLRSIALIRRRWGDEEMRTPMRSSRDAVLSSHLRDTAAASSNSSDSGFSRYHLDTLSSCNTVLRQCPGS